VQLGMVGPGRMGGNMVRRLLRARHQCVVFDRSPAVVRTFFSSRGEAAYQERLLSAMRFEFGGHVEKVS
jgi:6-phosphogluconate dehydrogenase (decarboxylating)